MTTTTKATAAYPILAIDLGKYKSVACIVGSANDQRFTTIRGVPADCRIGSWRSGCQGQWVRVPSAG